MNGGAVGERDGGGDRDDERQEERESNEEREGSIPMMIESSDVP